MKPPKSRKNSDRASRSSLIRNEAIRLGFTACGISQVAYLHEEAGHLKRWLEKDYHGNMTYMKLNFNKRVDPEQLVHGAKSVISVTLSYFPSKGQTDPGAPVVAKYAYGEDYHHVVKQKLRRLLQYINGEIGDVKGRTFVDTAPVLDRAWAARAGLGWIGKNTNLISRDSGSFIVIGSLIVDIVLDYDNPVQELCGDCTLCMEACPTSAIIAPRVIDARRCISYLTVESKDEISKEFRRKLKNRVFGCDICQDVCPWNAKAVTHNIREFDPLPGILEMTRKEWYRIDDKKFHVKFDKSPIRRTGYQGIKRNLDFILDIAAKED